MLNNSRTHNVIRNSYVGIFSQVILAVLGFIKRTFFINILGVQYLGINGLYSNILSILALSDLGIYTVMLFSLYKPLEEKDEKKIASLVYYFQKLYIIIGCIMLFLGVLLIPLLPYFVRDVQLSELEITKYYLLYLLNSVVSYVAISKATLLRADQRIDIIQISTTCITFIMNIIQIGLLMLSKNFTIYIIIEIIFNLLCNILLSKIAEKRYPYLLDYNDKLQDTLIKQEIKDNLKSTFLYKFGNIIMNSSQNIIISIFLGTSIVGYFSNYVTVYSIVDKCIMILIGAMLASIGSFFVSKSKEQKLLLFKSLLLLFSFIATFTTSCYISSMEDFICFWIGRDFVIEGNFIFFLAFNRYIFCLLHPIWMIRESSGIFVSTKYVMLSSSAINILLSMLLVDILGLSGIILAVSLSYILTLFWYEPMIIYKKFFNLGVFSYFKYITILIICSLPTIILSIILRNFPYINLLHIFTKFFICLLSSITTYYVFFRDKEEFLWIMNKIQCRFSFK